MLVYIPHRTVFKAEGDGEEGEGVDDGGAGCGSGDTMLGGIELASEMVVALFTHEGGVDVGDVDAKALSIDVKVGDKLNAEEIKSKLLVHVAANVRANVKFVEALYDARVWEGVRGKLSQNIFSKF